jgi:hypothetical protein
MNPHKVRSSVHRLAEVRRLMKTTWTPLGWSLQRKVKRYLAFDKECA